MRMFLPPSTASASKAFKRTSSRNPRTIFGTELRNLRRAYISIQRDAWRRRNRLPSPTTRGLRLKNNQFVTFTLVTFPAPSTAFFKLFSGRFPTDLLLLSPLRFAHPAFLERAENLLSFSRPASWFFTFFQLDFSLCTVAFSRWYFANGPRNYPAFDGVQVVFSKV